MGDVRTTQATPLQAAFTAKDGTPLIWDATAKKAYMLDASGNVQTIGGRGVVLVTVSKISATIVTAKLTNLGANGSMTFVNGVLTAHTDAT